MQFMGWERSFEKRVLAIRDKELKYQKLNYTIEVIYLSFVLGFCNDLSSLDALERHLVRWFMFE
jgi:hypothetical protein